MSLKLKNNLGFQQPAEKVSIQSTDWRQNDGGSNKSRTLKRKPRRFMLKKHPTCHPFCLLLHLQIQMVVFFHVCTKLPLQTCGLREESWTELELINCLASAMSSTENWTKINFKRLVNFDIGWSWSEMMKKYPFLAANVRQDHVKCWRDRCKRFFSGRFSP